MTWELAGTITVIVTAIVGAATAYLRLSIGKAVSEAKLEILREVDGKYATRESLENAKESIREIHRTRR